MHCAVMMHIVCTFENLCMYISHLWYCFRETHEVLVVIFARSHIKLLERNQLELRNERQPSSRNEIRATDSFWLMKKMKMILAKLQLRFVSYWFYICIDC